MYKNIRKFVFIVLIMIVGFYLYQNYYPKLIPNQISDQIDESLDLLHIYFMDVGEADSTLIRYKDKNVLIDGGNTVDGKKLVSFYKSIGVDHFDVVVGTHAHEDHIGGFNFLLRKFPVYQFYMPSPAAEWKSYSNMLDALEENHISYEVPNIDDSIVLDDLSFHVLWIGNDQEDHNYNAISLKLDYLDTSYLFMSDSPIESEDSMLHKNIQSNVLKVGHHGSNHASSAKFLKEVSPNYCVISVGKDNDYGFPKQVTLDKLERISCTVYRTDKDHTIHLMSDGYAIQFEFIDTDTNGGDLQ